MAKLPAAQRRDLAEQAFEKNRHGWSFTRIAKELGISRQTVSKLVSEQTEARHDERDHGYEDALAIARYELVIEKALDDYETTGSRSLNKAGLLNCVLRAQENIDKITGVLAPTEFRHLSDYEVVWNDIDPRDPELDGARAELELEAEREDG